MKQRSRLGTLLRHKPTVRLPRTKPGASPGSLDVSPDAQAPSIDVIAYDNDDYVQKANVSLEQVQAILSESTWTVVWININGLGDAGVLERLGELFKIHPLAIEDVINIPQRPKIETYADFIFILTRMVRYNRAIDVEQVSIFLSDQVVLTFQERPGDCFDEVRKRITQTGRRIRGLKADYLAYALLDAIIDNYFIVMEAFGNDMEVLEELVLREASDEVVPHLFDTRRELLRLRRTVWPQREALMTLLREQSPFFKPETLIYLRDCHDHAAQIVDIIESYREMSVGLMDVYLSQVGQRTNEIMKVLTIMAAIFIPLSFIAGLYGMNFDPEMPWNMPELDWPFGYFFALGLMATTALALVAYFWKKGWIGGGSALQSIVSEANRRTQDATDSEGQ